MRQVAIVGKAGTYAFAPFRDESWEIWGMPWIVTPQASRFFDMHSQECWVAGPQKKTDAEEWMAKSAEKFPDVPVYCDPTRMHAYKGAVEYPLGDVMASLPIPFLENSIAYMVALAIHERVERIGLYGVHLMGSGEYAYERPSVTYLVGLAQGRGIDVVIPPGSPLFISDFNAGRYGQAGGRRF
jgi:hypothetical protein